MISRATLLSVSAASACPTFAGVTTQFVLHRDDEVVPLSRLLGRISSILHGGRCSMLLGCGLRRRELVELTFDHLQQREDHWAIVDLVGKAGHVRTVPVPGWVKCELQEWLNAAAIDRG